MSKKLKRPNPALSGEENPEWTAEDFRRAKPAREALPQLFGPDGKAKQLTLKKRTKALRKS
jgi:hypothetical protein